MTQAQLGGVEDARHNLRRAVELAEKESHPMISQIRDALAAIEAGSQERQEPVE